MTDNDIIKALECCKTGACISCPRWKKEYISGDCTVLTSYALSLINRQKTEIEQLRHKYALAVAERETNVKGFTEQLSKTKTEAITEFAERLKATPKRFRVEYVEYFDRPSIEKLVLFIDDNDIDQIAKEMKEGVGE